MKTNKTQDFNKGVETLLENIGNDYENWIHNTERTQDFRNGLRLNKGRKFTKVIERIGFGDSSLMMMDYTREYHTKKVMYSRPPVGVPQLNGLEEISF